MIHDLCEAVSYKYNLHYGIYIVDSMTVAYFNYIIIK